MKTCVMLLLLFFIVPHSYAMDWEFEGKKFTKYHEGFSSTQYKDRNTTSIGYGFNCQVFDCPEEISEEEASEVFEDVYRDAQLRAMRFIGEHWVNLSAVEKLVVTDMAYNLGNKIFQFKKFRSALIHSDHLATVSHMKDSMWYGQVGRRSKNLVASILSMRVVYT